MSRLAVLETNVGRLKEGINFIGQDTQSFIIFKSEDGSLKACRNTCNHQRGKFVRDIEDVVKCTRHGWKLNCRTMCYTEPPNAQEQKELEVAVDGDKVTLYDNIPEKPWGSEQPTRLPLTPGECVIRYYNHACMSVTCGDSVIFTDPWLHGPAVSRGWWLLHKPPADWLENLARADVIYISHRHTDHLNYPTLKLLAEVNPDARIVTARLNPPVWCGVVTQLPFHVEEVEIGVWTSLGEHGRFMILGDATLPDVDTCLLVEYKGHRVFNTVDCSNPNGGVLPDDVDVLLSEFSGGSSVFPVCFPEMFGDATRDLVAKKGQAMVANALSLIKDTRARAFIPFAGTFIEAHPNDALARHNNAKTSSADMCGVVRKTYREVVAWDAWPGGRFDLAGMQGDSPPPDATIFTEEWDFEFYDQQARECVKKAGERSLEDMKNYWKWIDFKGYDLILHMVEMTEDFGSEIRSYFVDFLDLSFPKERPPERPYIRFRIRYLAAQLSLINNIPLQEMIAGFHIRVFVEPNIYHHAFYQAIANVPNKPPLFSPPVYTDI